MPRHYSEDEESRSSCCSDDDEEESSGYSDECSEEETSYPRKRCGEQFYQQQSSRPEKKMRVEGNAKQGVYVLRNSRTNKLYVGKSSNVDSRIRQHRNENGKDNLIRETLLTTGSTNDLESWERNEVLTRMYRNGMDTVRGWRYTSRGSLTQDDMISAKNDIVEKFDLCRRCGRNTHFADQCFARSPATWCKNTPMM